MNLRQTKSTALFLAIGVGCAAHVPGQGVVEAVTPDSVTPFALDVAGGASSAVTRFAVTARARGALSIWIDASAPITLGATRADGTSIGQDDGDGGVRAPWLLVEVAAGEPVTLTVRAERTTSASLVVRETVETPATDALAADVRSELAAIEKLPRTEVAAAGEHLRTLLRRVRDAAGPKRSRSLEDATFHIGRVAWYRALRAIASDAWAETLAAREATLPEDHPELLRSRFNHASTLLALDKLEDAAQGLARVMAGYERTLPEGHDTIQLVRINYASLLGRLGRLPECAALEREAIAALERTRPETDPNLRTLRMNHAVTQRKLGRLEDARAMHEKLLEVGERTLQETDLDLQRIRVNYAVALNWLGRSEEARALQAKALAIFEDSVPVDDREVLELRLILAATLNALRRPEEARALVEQVLAVREKTLPETSRDLLRIRGEYAATLLHLQRFEEAVALLESVLEVLETRYPEDPVLLTLRANYSFALVEVGRVEEALAVREKVLRARKRTLPEGHPNLLVARSLYAGALLRLERLEEGRAVEEQLLAACEEQVSASDPRLRSYRKDHSTTLFALGRDGDARRLVQELLQGARDHLEILARTSFGTVSTTQLHDLHTSWILSHLSASDPGGCLLLVESARDLTVRHASLRGLAQRAPAEARATITEHLQRLRQLDAELSGLSSGGAGADAPPDLVRTRLRELVTEKERTQRELAETLATVPATSRFLRTPSLDDVVASLGSDDALVSIWPYVDSRLQVPGRYTGWVEEDSYVAFVVTSDRPPRAVPLGPRASLDAAITGWRSSVGKPVEARGVGSAESDSGDAGTPSADPIARRLARFGHTIRHRVLDPILALTGPRSRLLVAVGGSLHLVPLDALPAAEGDGLVGDAVEIRPIAGVFQWGRSRGREVDSAPSLLALGGIDYDAAKGGGSASTPPLGGSDAGYPDREMMAMGEERLPPLPGTRAEIRRLERSFRAAFGDDARRMVLVGSAAGKAALEAHAPHARYLHIATHGFFAPENVPSLADEDESMSRDPSLSFLKPESLRGRFRGFAPATLCGLALAGANARPADGEPVAGVITAAELAHLDLSGCELAVLSACETNVGIQRASQGIASLQEALHAAGARYAITSLWRVSDRASMELMTEFYRRMWDRKEAPRRALWNAKRKLRSAGYAVEDWAAWVLSG